MHSDPTRAILHWHVLAGVDETLAALPTDAFVPVESAAPVVASPAPAPRLDDSQAAPPPIAPAPARPAPPSGEESVKTAVHMAEVATSFEALRDAVAQFDGCALKKTATNLVFADGNPAGRALLIGEAPGAEEDRQGKPFVGPSGRLLDKMLASIGLDRDAVLISNTVFWRPPGNRTPTPQETATCQPFIERLVEIMEPDVIVPLGGPAAKSMLAETLGIGKLRGRWFNYATARLAHPIDATPLFHPAYLLRTPAQKRAAWRDLLMIRRRLDEKAGG